jgi:hypothetical protein
MRCLNVSMGLPATLRMITPPRANQKVSPKNLRASTLATPLLVSLTVRHSWPSKQRHHPRASSTRGNVDVRLGGKCGVPLFRRWTHANIVHHNAIQTGADQPDHASVSNPILKVAQEDVVIDPTGSDRCAR